MGNLSKLMSRGESNMGAMDRLKTRLFGDNGISYRDIDASGMASADVNERIRFAETRRKILKYGALGSALVASGLYSLPGALAQTNQQTTPKQTSTTTNIEIGLSAAPVTVDGMVTAAEYIDAEDTIPYPYVVAKANTSKPPQGYLRAKYSPDWTYIGVDIPSGVSHQKGNILR